MEQNKNELMLSSSKANELALQREMYIADSELENYTELVSSRINSFKGKTSYDILLVLALNKVNKREDTQYESYPLTGMDSVISGTRDYEVLANNNYVVNSSNPADIRNRSTKSVVYFIMTVENTELEHRVKSNEQRLREMLEVYSMFVDDFELHVFFDTDDYAEYVNLVEELELMEGIEYHAVNSVTQNSLEALADVVIRDVPPLTITALLEDPLSSLGIPFNLRRSKVAVLPQINTNNLPISYNMLWHLLSQRLVNLVAGDQLSPVLASFASSMWLLPQNYKFRGEYIQDFFNAPSVVSVSGLSPINRGIITKRVMDLQVTLVAEGRAEETKLTIDKTTEVGLVEDEETLRKALLISTYNTRNNLVQINGQVYRVNTVTPTLTIRGKCLHAYTAKSHTIKKMEAITFLSPYHRPQAYEKLVKAEGAIPYSLPERFIEYIKRSASIKGHMTEGTEWFRRENLFLPDILEAMSEFNLESILAGQISPLYGVRSKSITVDWGAL